jgi:ribosomal protein S18 acetylase RimI-like enzyme
MNACAYCDANALYRDRDSSDYVCPIHARLEVTGPRGEAPRAPLTIRPATSADQARIAALSDYFWGENEVESFGRSYQVDELPAYVACDDDEIVGVAGYALDGDETNLVVLNVLPQWQGRGAARDLVAAVIKAMQAEGVKRIILSTTNDDLPALGLYQRLGFTITNVDIGKMVEHHGGEELGFAGISVRDEIQMELNL